jgi:hypothetical protein
MKTTLIKTIAVALAMQCSFLQAGNGASTATSPLAQQIGSHMSFPKSLLQNQKQKAQVRISFRLNASGEKEILAVNGPTEELKRFVVKAVLDTPVGESTERDKEYNMVFDFQLI